MQIPETYDDGGFTGGNMERPGLTRLMADIESGKVDCVVAYKVDRLSRSLLDFARMMSAFDEHKIVFPKTPLLDPQGKNPKPGRAYAVISSSKEIADGEPYWVVAITGEITPRSPG